MKLALKILFAFIFVWMIVATVRTSLEVSLWDAWGSFAANPWAVATLYDAYAGFLTFYCWVAYKERSWGYRILWFVLIMALGNIAMSAYALIQLFRTADSEPVESVLWRRA